MGDQLSSSLASWWGRDVSTVLMRWNMRWRSDPVPFETGKNDAVIARRRPILVSLLACYSMAMGVRTGPPRGECSSFWRLDKAWPSELPSGMQCSAFWSMLHFGLPWGFTEAPCLVLPPSALSSPCAVYTGLLPQLDLAFLAHSKNSTTSSISPAYFTAYGL